MAGEGLRKLARRASAGLLLAFSLLMIGVACVTLVVGWGTADTALTVVSVGASALGGLCLPLAWYESRRLARRGIPPEELDR